MFLLQTNYCRADKQGKLVETEEDKAQIIKTSLTNTTDGNNQKVPEGRKRRRGGRGESVKCKQQKRHERERESERGVDE